MGDAQERPVWPPKDREDRESGTASWPARAARTRGRPDREVARNSRSPWGADADREDRELDREFVTGDDDREGQEPDEELPSPYLARLNRFRFSRDSSRTTIDKINWALHAAYAMDKSAWRTANILFAYTIGPAVTIVCDIIKWAFGDNLGRFLIAVPVLVAVLFLLNQIPVIELAVPDQWDVSNLPVFQSDPADTVEVPDPRDGPVVGGE